MDRVVGICIIMLDPDQETLPQVLEPEPHGSVGEPSRPHEGGLGTSCHGEGKNKGKLRRPDKLCSVAGSTLTIVV